MKKIQLKFPSAVYLIAFRRYAKSPLWEIDLNNLTVQCECSAGEIAAACRDFRAEVIAHQELKTEGTVLSSATPDQHRYAS